MALAVVKSHALVLETSVVDGGSVVCRRNSAGGFITGRSGSLAGLFVHSNFALSVSVVGAMAHARAIAHHNRCDEFQTPHGHHFPKRPAFADWGPD